MARKAIPIEVKNNIMIKSKRRCAYCFGLYNDLNVKNGQIAHIDRDNENNLEENLAYLCLDHHNLYDTKYRQTVSFYPNELLYYKKKLEEYIRENLDLLNNSSQTFNNKICNSHDYEMFLNIKEICLDTGNLDRLINFNFGKIVPESYFCIDKENTILLYDYFYMAKNNINYYFRDPKLDEFFNNFLYYLSLATERLSNSYIINQNNSIQLNNSLNKTKDAKEFYEYVENIKMSFTAFLNRAIKLGLFS